MDQMNVAVDMDFTNQDVWRAFVNGLYSQPQNLVQEQGLYQRDVDYSFQDDLNDRGFFEMRACRDAGLKDREEEQYEARPEDFMVYCGPAGHDVVMLNSEYSSIPSDGTIAVDEIDFFWDGSVGEAFGHPHPGFDYSMPNNHHQVAPGVENDSNWDGLIDEVFHPPYPGFDWSLSNFQPAAPTYRSAKSMAAIKANYQKAIDNIFTPSSPGFDFNMVPLHRSISDGPKALTMSTIIADYQTAVTEQGNTVCFQSPEHFSDEMKIATRPGNAFEDLTPGAANEKIKEIQALGSPTPLPRALRKASRLHNA